MLGARGAGAESDGAHRELARHGLRMAVRVSVGKGQHRLHRNGEQSKETEAGAAPEEPHASSGGAHNHSATNGAGERRLARSHDNEADRSDNIRIYAAGSRPLTTREAGCGQSERNR